MPQTLRRPSATDPWVIRASDGAAIYDLPDKAQLPAALDSGALKVKEQVPLTEISLSAATLAALETVNAIISDGGATISIDDGAASITVDGSVALDAGTLAALETINAVVSGTVALDAPSLAALETTELGSTSLAALESITVVGALTDAELRASPVPVSGTVTTGGLTDTQLRATPVSVEQATSVDVADGGGSLTVDGPATDAQLRATPLPVSGTVATGGLTDTQLRATPVPISVDAAALAALETTELGATTLAALETINAVISDGGGTITVDDGAASLTVDGTVALDATTLAALETVNAVISGEVALDAPSLAALETIELGATSLAALESITATGPLTDTQLRATPVPVSGTVTTGGLTDTQLRATPVSVEQATSVDVADGGGSLTVDGPLTDAQLAARLPLSVEQATSVDVADGGGSLTVDSAQLPSALATDRLKVDGSGVTQPVSGTVTANAGSGTQAVSGPLTDAQLRASVVPVDSELTTSDLDSGGGTDTRAVVGVVIPGSGGGVLMSQPATDAQLRATPLPVSGTVTASGPLTDTQLRASAVSVEQATSVTVDAGTGPFPVSDNGGSITVDAPSGTPVRTDPTGTTAQPVTDNAGSLTVDSPGLPVALDGVSLKVKEQSPLVQAQTDAQFAARLPLATVSGQPAATTGNLTAAAQDVTATGLGPYSVAVVTAQGTYTGANIGFYYEGALGIGARAMNAQTGIAAAIPTSVSLVNNSDDNMWIVPLYGSGSLQVYANTVASGTVAISIQPSAAPVSPLVTVPSPLPVDTELPAAAALGDAMGNPTAPVIGANNLLFHSGSVWARQLSAPGVNADATVAAIPAAGLFGYNGSTWDRLRTNVDGTALTSSAKTTTANGTSADLVNYNARGVQIALNITNIVTACSIQPNIQGKDVLSGVYYKLAADPTAVTATGLYVYEFYPGASTAAAGGITARVAASLPRTWRVIVTHGNSNAITYSVGFSLIL